MNLAFLVGFAALAWNEPSFQAANQIERKFGERTEILRLGDSPGPFEGLSTVTEGKYRFAATPDGRISQPFLIDGGAKDLLAAEQTSRSAPVSRVKIFLLPQVDWMAAPNASSPPQFRRPVRGRMEKAEVDAFYQETVRFAAMAQAGLGGAARVEVDVQVDANTYFTEGSRPFESAELLRYVAPRVNGAPFESDDKTYRGPYDLVLVAHAGMAGSSESVAHWGTPVASLSALRTGLLGGPNAVSNRLVTLYANALGFSARSRGAWDASSAGFAQNDKAVSYFWGSNGAKVEDFRRASTDNPFAWHSFSGPRFDAPRTSDVSWQSVQDDPWAKLKFLSGTEIRELFGVQDSGYSEVRDPKTGLYHGAFYVGDSKNQNPRPFRLDSVVDLEHENIGKISSGGQTYFWVATRVAPLVFANWKGSTPPSILGVGLMADRPFVIAKVSGSVPATTEAELIGLTSAPFAETDPDLKPSQEGLRWGTSNRDWITDPIAGAALQLKLVFPLYLGGMQLMQPRFEKGVSLEPGQGIRLRLKANDSGKWQLRLHLSGGQKPEVLGQFSVPAEQVGQWLSVDVPIENPGPGAQLIDLWLETPDAENQRSPLAIRRAEIAVSSIELTQSENWFRSEPAAYSESNRKTEWKTSADPVERAYFAVSASEGDAEAVAALLDDPHDLVRLNACFFFARNKYPLAEPKLADLSRWMDPRVSQAACRALMAQETVSGQNAVKTTLEIGPSDDNRLFAAEALTSLQDVGIMSDFAALYGSRKWQVRQAAAFAISQMKDRNAALLLMVFLQELDPVVRLTVTENADAQFDNVLRQLLYSSVNDTSETVRARSYLRLADAPSSQYANEGLKGVRDESWVVRTSVLMEWATRKDEKFRGVFRQGVIDTVPQVRVAALLGFAQLPGEVKLEEIQPVLADTHPAVVKALEDLKKAKDIR